MKAEKELKEKIKGIFHESIASHKENCFCSVDGLCDNCKSKETVFDLYKKIQQVFGSLIERKE